MKSRFYFSQISLFILGIIILSSFSWRFAQASLDIGLTEVSSSIVLAQTDPITVAVKIINTSALFLGIITVVIIIYGGIQYLMAAGDSEMINRARKTIFSALIGLMIVLASWTIASSIVGRLVVDSGAQLTDADFLAVVDTGIVPDNGGGELPCIPNCENKECGSDGCEGLCGTCDYESFCNDENLCEIYTACADGVEISVVDPTPTDFVCGVSTVFYEGGPYNSGGTIRNMGGYYRTVKVGEQCWLKDNINVGTRINSCVNGPCVDSLCAQDCFASLSSFNTATDSQNTMQKYCYNDLESNCDLYGGLYNWIQAMQLPWFCYDKTWNGSNCNSVCNYSAPPSTQDVRRGICPPGWHIPTDSEQYVLSQLYASPACTINTGDPCYPTGDALKLADDCSTPGNLFCGSSGLDLPLGGGRIHTGAFAHIGNAYYWSASQSGSHHAYNRDIGSYSAWWKNNNSTLYSWPVRCLKD